MNCTRAQQLWHDRFDDRLSGGAEAGLAAHLASCGACRRYHADMDRLADGLERLRVLSEQALAAPEQDRYRPAGRVRQRLWWRATGLTRVAAAVALFVAGSAYISRELAQRGVPRPGSERETVARLPEEAEYSASLTLTGESAELYLAVARPSGDPRVHVFWLYDAYPTNER